MSVSGLSETLPEVQTTWLPRMFKPFELIS
jgi:hypothetical protein